MTTPKEDYNRATQSPTGYEREELEPMEAVPVSAILITAVVMLVKVALILSPVIAVLWLVMR